MSAAHSYLALRAASLASLIVAPVAIVQAVRLRRTIPRLREAAGPRNGIVGEGDKPLRVLIFGESTAAGVGADTQTEALGGQVATAFSAALDRPIAYRILGKNGVTARAASAELVPKLANYQCDLVIIAIGANDTFRLRSGSAWQRDINAMLHGIRYYLGPVPILFSGLPPVGQFPALVPPLRQVLGIHAKRLNAAAKQTIDQLDGVWHLDSDFPTEPSFYGPDRFHPGPLGYRLWAEMLASSYVDLPIADI